MIATEREPFKPVAVLIPADALPPERDHDSVVDPADCTLLHLDSRDNSGWLYTKDEWESGAEPRIYRRYGHHEGLAEGETVELLPDVVIVKLDEREYWCDEWILERTTAIYTVYVIDRRQHHHLCSFEANYEAYYLGTQFDEVPGLSDEDHEELWERINEGALANEQYSYFAVDEIDRILQNTCREGWTPANGKSGGYAIDTGMVRTEDAYRYCQEANCRSEL
jgi:hypothetical protein